MRWRPTFLGSLRPSRNYRMAQIRAQEEPTAWSENVREICNFLGIVDTYLLVTGFVQLDAVEHAH